MSNEAEVDEDVEVERQTEKRLTRHPCSGPDA